MQSVCFHVFLECCKEHHCCHKYSHRQSYIIPSCHLFVKNFTLESHLFATNFMKHCFHGCFKVIHSLAAKTVWLRTLPKKKNKCLECLLALLLQPFGLNFSLELWTILLRIIRTPLYEANNLYMVVLSVNLNLSCCVHFVNAWGNYTPLSSLFMTSTTEPIHSDAHQGPMLLGACQQASMTFS